MNAVGLTIWVLISVAHSGKPDSQPEQYLGVYATEAACEHMLAALSDPAFGLPNKKPSFMICIAEHPQ
jgi:hypothetical protein